MRAKNLKKINEGFGDDARRIEKDQEVQMMRSQLYRIARDAMSLYDHLGSIDPETDLPSWTQKKITLAEEQVRTVNDFMKSESEPAIDDYRTEPVSMPSDEIWMGDDLGETITAGSIATVSKPLGKKKKTNEEVDPQPEIGTVYRMYRTDIPKKWKVVDIQDDLVTLQLIARSTKKAPFDGEVKWISVENGPRKTIRRSSLRKRGDYKRK